MKQSPIKTPSTPSGTAAQAVVDRLNAKEKIVWEVFTKKRRKNSWWLFALVSEGKPAVVKW